MLTVSAAIAASVPHGSRHVMTRRQPRPSRDAGESGLSRPSTVSTVRMLGWTQEVPDFPAPVQAVQPVQPKLKVVEKEALPTPAVEGPLPLHSYYRFAKKGGHVGHVGPTQQRWAFRTSNRRIGRLDEVGLR